jgi:hypothetical protein
MMRKSSKIAVAVAFAGMAAVGGAAFTGAGLTNSAPTQFIGGTVTSTVTGATLTNVAYSFTDASNIRVDQIAVTLTGATGKTVTGLIDGTTAITFTDTADLGGAAGDGVFESDLGGTPYDNVDSLAITVA